MMTGCRGDSLAMTSCRFLPRSDSKLDTLYSTALQLIVKVFDAVALAVLTHFVVDMIARPNEMVRDSRGA
jgi:hypothetical protein